MNPSQSSVQFLLHRVHLTRTNPFFLSKIFFAYPPLDECVGGLWFVVSAPGAFHVYIWKQPGLKCSMFMWTLVACLFGQFVYHARGFTLNILKFVHLYENIYICKCICIDNYVRGGATITRWYPFLWKNTPRHTVSRNTLINTLCDSQFYLRDSKENTAIMREWFEMERQPDSVVNGLELSPFQFQLTDNKVTMGTKY